MKYQRIDKPTPSKLPPPPLFDELSVNNQGGVPPNISKEKLSKEKLIEDILCDLNSLLGSTYKTTSHKTAELIEARLKEGFTVEDFKTVHRKKFKDWGKDREMMKFLRPITLYSNKFESYLNQKEAEEKKPAEEL